MGVQLFSYVNTPFCSHKFDESIVIDLETPINITLKSINLSLRAAKLSLNAAKTEFMVINSRQEFQSINNITMAAFLWGDPDLDQ